MKKVFLFLMVAALPIWLSASDHVMDATKGVQRDNLQSTEEGKILNLSLKEAQDYAVKQNRSLHNASLAVQEAYAQRWQTIAAMLPTLDASYSYSDMFKYQLDFGGMPMSMANTGTFNLTAAVGINGQAIVGALLNNIAIDMKKITLEQSESELRGNVLSSYVSVLALQSISDLLDSSLVNIEQLLLMTQSAVDVGAAEQTTADQIKVRANAIKNNITTQRNAIELAKSALKVLLDVPVHTQIELTDNLEGVLSGERVLGLLGEDFKIENNLNYQMLSKNVQLAKRNVHMAGWAYGPTLSMAYQYSDVKKFGNGFGGMSMPHVLNLSVKMPLWSSGKRAAGVVEKKIALEQAKNTLSETGDQLEIQYQQLRNNLTSAYETYLNERDNIIVTKRVFASATEKFRYGTSSSLELTNASNDLISAQSTYVQAMLSLVNAQVELEKFLNN